MHHSLPHALSDARESEDEITRYSMPSATPQAFSHNSPSLKLHHEAYTIAWICGLHIEMAAAISVLDELHGPLKIDPDDSNTYQLGHIGQHNVVIACLPAQGYGTVNAALVATNLKRSFPFAHTGLMVGIGGGVPNMGDIRLGDVVVGTRVMQHDFGKFIGDARMITTAVPRLPPLRLCTAVSALRAEHELLPSRIPQILQDKFAGKSAFARPTAPDRLFRADYEHEGSHINCNECDWSNLFSRCERSSSDIRIHYGGIASGNQVIKNGMIRDAIAKAHDIVCFEMEAAGIVDSLPCLIVRGICDYADSHKNKEWQRFAASTAAAKSKASFLADDIKHKERRQGLLESLQFPQMDARRVTIENAHASTCAWFFDHPKFHEWLDPQMIAHHHGFLWLSGKPGAGKSTIMKFTYLELKKATSRENSLIASFFFNARGDTLEKTVQGMFRSLLLQLLEGYPYLQVVLDDPDIIPRGQKTCPCLNTLRDLLSKAILTLGSKGFTCFVDALDECDEQQAVDMVQYFEDLAERSSSQGVPFKICFSSRHYPHIAVKRAIRLTLEDEQGHFQDLNLYITNRLRIDESHILEKVGSLLIKKAAGVFIWVVLVVEMLDRDYRRGGIVLHQKLKKLPSDLSELFRDILRRDGDDVEDLRLGLLWILFAKRPLRLQEFRHAVWSGLSPEELSEEDQDFTSDTHFIESMIRFVIASTKGLAEITKGSKPIVQFIHESVRDFLIKDQGLNQLWPEIGPNPETSSHQVLRDSCQKYLSLVFARMPNNCANSPRSERKKLLQRYPFSVYACSYILRHSDSAATSHSQDEFLQGFKIDQWVKLNNFLEEPSLRKYHSGSLEYVLADLGSNWSKETVASLLGISSHIYHGTDITDVVNPRRISETSRGLTPLVSAMKWCHFQLAQLLLLQGVDPNDSRRRTSPALDIALRKRNHEVAKLLLECGANMNYAPDENPLFLACTGGFDDVVSLLLDHGVSVELQNSSFETPLYCASKNGHLHTVTLLIKRGATINHSSPRSLHSSLLAAAEQGKPEVARFLIRNGADVNACDRSGFSPLTKSAQRGHLSIVQLLLEAGAEFDGSGSSPLIEACAHDHTQVVRFLLRNGANVDVFDQSGFSPLTRPCERGYLSLVLALLESGIDVTKPDRTGQAAITTTNDTNIILLLLGHGADIHVRDLFGNPILTRASQNNNLILVTRLIKLGADVNAENIDGRTALLETTDARIASLLIEHGADVNACDRFGNTAVFRSVSEGNQALLSILLVKGANVNRVNLMGRTALTEALSTRVSIPQAHILNDPLSKPLNDDILRILVRGGADINTCDVQGNTILSHAVTNYDCTLARFLLEKGADVTITDRDGQTVLFKVRDATMAQLLLEHGADVNARDALHQTPLLASIVKREDEVAKTLIDHKADVNAKSKYGLTPLMLLACRVAGILPKTLDVLRPRHWLKYSFEDMPMLFSVSDAKANETLYSFVEFSWERKLARLLVSRGANVNISTRFSETPLLMAMAGRMNYDFVLFLIKHGADVNVRTTYGLTPLQQARKKRRSVIVDLLLQHGASEVENFDV
ncbi:Uncharacterized protein PECH_001310 [Penicillium ucsense]|uniref:Nucleoside phosphorylase domain-containing protein n=1 Tax=Penicillium ucsense TaxID=2839758 RepID=A0A8J8VXC0_9EURO|nr:Uncharacterized protein PECM_001057 [Penicillium ucsense]KAF7733000.1 Uncharacterized protein PECH_001310 [Penicillium ucsense]